jgi:hypothetical protein
VGHPTRRQLQQATAGWSCIYCNHSRKQVIVQRIREHMSCCAKVSSCDVAVRIVPMDPSDIRFSSSQAPPEAKREGLELAAAAEIKKQKADVVKALDVEEDDRRKAEIAQKHSSCDIKVSSSLTQPRPGPSASQHES